MCCRIREAHSAWCARGQSTVEAAVLLPVLFVALLLLLQPGIILYDRIVMRQAAVDACRLLATRDSSMSDDYCESLVLRHLGAIPSQELFHVHDGECSYEVQLSGGEESEWVSVRISNRVKPMPLLDAAGTLLGIVDGQGCLTVSVEERMRTQPSWVGASESGIDPSAWVQA